MTLSCQIFRPFCLYHPNIKLCASIARVLPTERVSLLAHCDKAERHLAQI